MNNSTKHTSQRQSGGLMLNLGIGIVLGLLVALLAVFLVTRGGPFKKDSATSNVLEQKNGESTDPNAPLYGSNAPSIMGNASNESAIANGQGIGESALTTGVSSATSATAETAEPVTPTGSDPVGAMINNANKTDLTKTTSNNKQPIDNNTTLTPKEVKPTATVPKEVKPTTAVPKDVKPATTSPSSAKSQGSYTIQAGVFNSASEAAAMKNKLAAQGQSASINEKKTADGNTIYRVRVGNYGSDKEAQAARAKVGGVVLETNK